MHPIWADVLLNLSTGVVTSPVVFVNTLCGSCICEQVTGIIHTM